ncbi:MAG: prepilin-type N-terminal cleavage/methylation domain-containing protein [Candidatus Hydrogenedentes bacterium]|nr:prepilin-type N-terminal cleavage/methylation domain-containing protein [Candidatus Hydrogenedentota bacterium]
MSVNGFQSGDALSRDWGNGACAYRKITMCGVEPNKNISCGMVLRGKKWRNQGFSLVEITVAMAILVTVLAFMAQGLASSYVILSLQTQRGTALNTCKSVISNLRELARRLPAGDQCPDDEPRFPCVLVAWADGLPADMEQFEKLSPSAREPYEGLFVLPEQTIVVNLTDAGGAPAVTSEVLSNNTNPVYVRVVTSWTGPRGRTYQMQMSTVMTDR